MNNLQALYIYIYMYIKFITFMLSIIFKKIKLYIQTTDIDHENKYQITKTQSSMTKRFPLPPLICSE